MIERNGIMKQIAPALNSESSYLVPALQSPSKTPPISPINAAIPAISRTNEIPKKEKTGAGAVGGFCAIKGIM